MRCHLYGTQCGENKIFVLYLINVVYLRRQSVHCTNGVLSVAELMTIDVAWTTTKHIVTIKFPNIKKKKICTSFTLKKIPKIQTQSFH